MPPKASRGKKSSAISVHKGDYLVSNLSVSALSNLFNCSVAEIAAKAAADGEVVLMESQEEPLSTLMVKTGLSGGVIS